MLSWGDYNSIGRLYPPHKNMFRMGSDDPPSALLTSRQRKILQGEADITPRAERAARARIRERLRATIQDFTILSSGLDPQDIKKALARRASPPSDRERGTPLPAEVQEEIRLENGLADAIGIAYLAGLERSSHRPDTDVRFVEGRAEKGIRRALNQLGRSVKIIDVKVDIELGEEFDDLTGLTAAELAEYSMAELQQAHLDGAITDEQFFEAMEKQGRVVFRDDEPADEG